jgi:hypothetical protein
MKEEIISFETAKLVEDLKFETEFHDQSITAFYVSSSCGEYPWQKKGALVYFKDHLDETCCPNHDVPYKYRILAPTQSLLQKWLREEHGIPVTVIHFPSYNDGGKSEYVEYRYSIIRDNEVWDEIMRHKTYEEALEKGLQEGLKLINN